MMMVSSEVFTQGFYVKFFLRTVKWEKSDCQTFDKLLPMSCW